MHCAEQSRFEILWKPIQAFQLDRVRDPEELNRRHCGTVNMSARLLEDCIGRTTK